MQNKQKTRVVHIITRLDAGGSATNTLETVAGLSKEKYEAILITGRTNDPNESIERFISQKNIVFIKIDALRRAINPFLDLIAFVKLFFVLQKINPQIVHTHTSKAGILGRWAAFLNRVPIIIHTPHGHIFYGYFNKWVTRFFIFLERITAKITDQIISLTEIGKEEHIRYRIALENKFTTIYSGIRLQDFMGNPDAGSKIRENLGIPQEHRILGTVTRLEPIKGNQYLITAFGRVHQLFPKTSLLIVGRGSEEKALRNQCRDLGISTDVFFVGFQQDASPFLKAMDIFVLTSLNEGMGRVILEAMACAKPVIASHTGGIPELIQPGENGLLVPPGNVAELKEAMENILSDPQKAHRLGEFSRKRVTDTFTLDKMIKDIEKLYSKFLTDRI